MFLIFHVNLINSFIIAYWKLCFTLIKRIVGITAFFQGKLYLEYFQFRWDCILNDVNDEVK